MQIYRKITLKERPSDFVVTEVPCLPELFTSAPKGQSHTILKLTKQGLTTLECLRIIGVQLSLKPSQVQCLGLKDEDGVTEQLISVNAVLVAAKDIEKLTLALNGARKSYTSVSLQIHGYSTVPLKVKRLHGNTFSVRLRGLSQAEAQTLYASMSNQSSHHFINYYDQQRFGLPSEPHVAHLIGKAIVENKHNDIRHYYLQSGNAALDQIDESVTGQELLKQIDYKKIDFFVSAYTSYLWNNAVSESLGKSNALKCAPFEVFEGYSLLASGELLDVLVPHIPGYRFTSDRVLETYSKTRFVYTATNIFVDEPQYDGVRYHIDLQFFLPMGCYATMAIKQLLAVRLNEV